MVGLRESIQLYDPTNFRFLIRMSSSSMSTSGFVMLRVGSADKPSKILRSAGRLVMRVLEGDRDVNLSLGERYSGDAMF